MTDQNKQKRVLSVAICTHNPKNDYFTRVLQALARQTLKKSQWELLVVDNGSAPMLEGRIDLSWHGSSILISEPNVGKVFALVAAIEKASGDFFLIVDDDNLLRNDYLETALNIGRTHQWLGAWAGSCVPEFEIEPPSFLRPHLAALVIETLKRPVFANIPDSRQALPPGAGMTVRSCVARRWALMAKADPTRRMLGHAGNAVGAGEDADMALCSLHFDLAVGRFPELELTHLIPARKLNLSYIRKLYYKQAYANIILDHLHGRCGIENTSLLYSFAKHAFILGGGLLRAGSTVERLLQLDVIRGKFSALWRLWQNQRDGRGPC